MKQIILKKSDVIVVKIDTGNMPTKVAEELLETKLKELKKDFPNNTVYVLPESNVSMTIISQE